MVFAAGCKNAVYFLNARNANSTPKQRITIQEMAVTLQPKRSETKAIPYIEVAAPTYVQALQKPPTVDALPVPANLPGRQEMSRKLQECIQALIMPAKSKHTTLAAVCSTLIRIEKGMQRAIDRANKIPEPRASLLNKSFLCIILTKNRLIIEKIGNATDTRIDSSEPRLKASLYKVGSQDSIPSRIKPITIMQTKMGKIPERAKTCHTLPATSSLFG